MARDKVNEIVKDDDMKRINELGYLVNGKDLRIMARFRVRNETCVSLEEL